MGLPVVAAAARRRAIRAKRMLQWGHGLGAVDTGGGVFFGKDAVQLQWGHGLGAVDTRSASASGPACVPLQWGHGLGAVDS